MEEEEGRKEGRKEGWRGKDEEGKEGTNRQLLHQQESSIFQK